MMRIRLPVLLIVLVVALSGCASASIYVKPDAPWAAIKRVGVFPFATPYEDRVRRQWATQLFVKELQRLDRFEVVELAPPAGYLSTPDLPSVARTAGVDAYFQGTVEDMTEIFADLQLVDAATGETLWSTRYHRGAGGEFSIRYHTPQQQFQRIFHIILRRFDRTVF